MIQPSELPINTVIEDEDLGLWIRGVYTGVNVWFELHPHCSDCAATVSDDGTDDPSTYAPGITVKEKSDDYFTKFKVISVPVDISADLQDQILKGQSNIVETKKEETK